MREYDTDSFVKDCEQRVLQEKDHIAVVAVHSFLQVSFISAFKNRNVSVFCRIFTFMRRTIMMSFDGTCWSTRS